MISIRRNYERGTTELDWLRSKHTFSFGGYYDPCYKGVSALRVINEDHVAPGKGFATHSHEDMEIVSYVISGAVEHKDSLGNIQRVATGEFQLLSAGSGVAHSEYNPSDQDPLVFLQVWIEPSTLGVAPNYQHKYFKPGDSLQLVASPDGRDGTLRIHQSVSLYRILFNKRGSLTQELQSGRTAYVHVLSGDLSIDRKPMKAGDGAILQHISTLKFRTETGTEALVFELP